MSRRGRYRSGLDMVRISGTMEEREAVLALELHLKALGSGALQSTFVKNCAKYDAMHCNKKEKFVNRQLQSQQVLGQWVQQLQEENGTRDVVLRILVEGESFSQIDRGMKRRNGWARSEMGRALMIFQSLR